MKFLVAAFLGVGLAKEDPNEHYWARDKFIKELNAKPGMTWTAGHNDRFYNEPIGYAKTFCGAQPTPPEFFETEPGFKKYEKKGLKLPEDFDSATNWPQCAKSISDIRDQSACGCCWAFGAAESASDRLCITTNGTTLVPLSSQDMCFCGSDSGCDGGMLGTAWRFIKWRGLVTGGQYNNTGPFGAGYCSKFSLPHCHHHGPTGDDPYPDEGTTGCPTVDDSPSCPTSCDSDATSPHNTFSSDKYSFSGSVESCTDASDVAEAIYSGGPVETAFTVYSDFENYSGGVYQHTGGSYLGGHAVRIVGWGTDNGVDYWKVANSWNPYWGEDGYFRIKRGDDECGIESGAMAASSDAKWGPKSMLE